MNPTLPELSVLVAMTSAYCFVKLNSYAAIVIINGLWSLLAIYTWYRYSTWRLQGVPGPCYIPFCQCESTESKLSRNMKTHTIYSGWVGKYGKVFGYYGVSYPILAVADAGLAKQILFFNDDFNEPTDKDLYKSSCGESRLIGQQMTKMSGEKYRLFRNFMNPTFTGKLFEESIPLIQGKCTDLVACLIEKATTEGAQMITCSRRLLAEWMLNCLCELFTPFPSEMTEILREDCDDYRTLNPFPEYLFAFSPLLYKILSTHGLINLTYAPLQKRFDEMKRCEKLYQRRCSNESQKHDYLTMSRLRMKRIAENPSKNQFVPTENELFAQLFFLLNPNQFTNVLCTMFYELAMNRDIQDQCRSEAQLIYSLSSLNSYAAIVRNLPLILASLKESIRLHPLRSHLYRYVQKDVMLKGIQLTKGCAVAILVRDILQDKDAYFKPDAFIPQRFIERSLKDYKTDGTYLSFGMGRRRCMGEKHADSVICLLTAHMLRSFEIHLDRPDQQLNEDYASSVLTIDRTFKLKLKKLAENY